MRKRLEKLVIEFVGFDLDQVINLTDTELIVEVLEVLTDKVEELDGHTHTIN